MFLICRKDTHIETGESSFAWHGRVWNEPFSSKEEAEKNAKIRAEYCLKNEKAKDPGDPESVTVVSETEFIYNYFGATRVEFTVVEVKPC